MEIKNAIQECQEELHKALEANNEELANELRKKKQSLLEQYDKELVKKVKPEQVLSEFYRKKSRFKAMAPEFLRSLCETFLNDPVESDKFGSYKPGTFTHKKTIVVVELVPYVEDKKLWRAHIMSDEPIPDSVTWEIRDRLVPDRCSMMRLYESREIRQSQKEVIMMEFPETE